MRLRLSNGLALGYDVSGTGRPVAFLHPVGTRREMWDNVIELLGGEVRALPVDFRGHGDSDVPTTPFSLDDLADDVVELLRVQQATKAVVVGCSMGGMVAQAVARKAPELLAGLVLAGTSHTQTPESAAAMLKRAEAALAGMPTVVDMTLERWFPKNFAAAQPQVVQRVRGWLLEDDPVVFSWCWRAISRLDNSASLPAIDLPVLLIRGSLDASTAKERMMAMQGLLRRSRYVEMDGAGHLAPMEQPKVFAKLMRDFIGGEVAER